MSRAPRYIVRIQVIEHEPDTGNDNTILQLDEEIDPITPMPLPKAINLAQKLFSHRFKA